MGYLSSIKGVSSCELGKKERAVLFLRRALVVVLSLLFVVILLFTVKSTEAVLNTFMTIQHNTAEFNNDTSLKGVLSYEVTTDEKVSYLLEDGTSVVNTDAKLMFIENKGTEEVYYSPDCNALLIEVTPNFAFQYLKGSGYFKSLILVLMIIIWSVISFIRNNKLN